MLRDEGDGKINQNLMVISEILSDDRFGGGGPDDRYAQALDHFKKSDNNMFDDVWSVNYKGIYRCNMLLESLGNITFNSADDKNQIEGETRFLRAFYYFNLCKTFGNVPLVVTSQSKNPVQAPADSLYKQMGVDLQKAVSLLPATKTADMAHRRDTAEQSHRPSRQRGSCRKDQRYSNLLPRQPQSTRDPYSKDHPRRCIETPHQQSTTMVVQRHAESIYPADLCSLPELRFSSEIEHSTYYPLHSETDFEAAE